MLDVILDEVKKSLDSFNKLTGLLLSLYDEDMQAIYHTSNSCKFCRIINKNDISKKRCRQCEADGLEKTRKSKKSHIYRCHVGLTEAYIPICHNNLIIGYMRTGQILCNEDYSFVLHRVAEIEKECGYPEGKLGDLIKTLKVYDREYIDSFVKIIEMCGSYLYLSNIIKKKTYVLSDQLKDYIETHLSHDLSVNSICDKFYISRAKLYRLSAENFGMGISDYITYMRIEKAKSLLTSTDISISAVAEEAGYSEQNYFSRIFKKHTGLSPKEYRKKG